jgi:DNA repair exonuclease SbcCD nuclease subunit
MPKILIVGDVHVTPQELDDCKALGDLVVKTAVEQSVDCVLFLGDLYHANSIVHTPAIAFWNSLFGRLVEFTKAEIVALVGNHDQFSPTIRDPYSLIVHAEQSPRVHIVDKIQSLAFLPNLVLAPYYADHEGFLQDILTFKNSNPGVKTLVCHQTFDGAKFNEGFYAKDAVNPHAVPMNIIAGHIHTQHSFGNVWYPGSPRWRILSDANQEKHLHVVDMGADGNYTVSVRVSTGEVCRRIFQYVDSPESPANVAASQRDDVRVDVYGPPDYVRDRMVELKAKHSARCRPFPTKVRQQTVTEADGIEVSFKKYQSNFRAPNGTDINVLTEAVTRRLYVA